jgi:hypothetical protein
MDRRNVRWLLLAFVWLALPVAARAQSAGSISGVVRDASGAVISGVTVEAADTTDDEKLL